MQGITVFASMAEAEAAGFSFFMRSGDTIIVQRDERPMRLLAVVDPVAATRRNRRPA
jgi:hypothetical protein